MRTRLRPKYTDEELAHIYQRPHDHTRWSDHMLRVDITTNIAKWVAEQCECTSVADLSCGDGWIVDLLDLPETYKGDFAPGYEYTGPIEKTIDEIPDVDLFICSETIEHLDDPDAVLGKIANRAKRLVLSTPIGEADDSNPEHYWGWNVDDVKAMLHDAGWLVATTVVIDFLGNSTYDYQVHACTRKM